MLFLAVWGGYSQIFLRELRKLRTGEAVSDGAHLLCFQQSTGMPSESGMPSTSGVNPPEAGRASRVVPPRPGRRAAKRKQTAPAGSPAGAVPLHASGLEGPGPRSYIPTLALYHSVVWDFGRVMGSHQARLRMSWERRPMARETLKNTV